jgi:hypothetical protein
MPLSRLLFLLLPGVLIFSCKEDEVELVEYPSAYHKSGVETAGTLRVFSSAGEIKTESVISRFSQYDTANYNYVIRIIRDYKGFMDTLKFVDSKNAVLNHYYADIDCSLQSQGDLLILSETKITKQCCSFGEVLTRTLRYYLGKVKPEVQSEYLVSSVRGYYYFGYESRNKYVLTKSHGKLVAPMLQFSVHSASVYDGGFVNNIFESDGYKHLAEGDTLTIMESNIVFEK